MLVTFTLCFFLCLLLSALFSGLETGIYSLEGVRLQVRAGSGDRLANRLLLVASDPSEAVCTILLVNNLVNAGVAFFSGELLAAAVVEDLNPLEMELLSTVLVVPVLFIFGELVPKDLFLRFPMRLVPIALPFQLAARTLLKPLVVLLMIVIRRLGRGTPEEPTMLSVRRDELSGLLTSETGVPMTTGQRRLASKVMDLRAVPVRERMVPKEAICSVPKTATRDEILAAGERHRHSRLLVEDPSGSGYLGYLNVLDVLFSEGDLDLDTLLHPLPTARPDEPVTRVLTRLQRARRPLALVSDGEGALGIIGPGDIIGQFFGLLK